MTFYCRPPGFLLYFPPDPADAPSHLPGPIAPEVWREHRDEFSRLSKDSLLRALNDSEAGVILLAGLSGARPLGRAPLTTETAAVLNEDYHLALKLKVLGLRDKVRPLKPPRRRTTPAPALRDGTAAEAGMRPEAAVEDPRGLRGLGGGLGGAVRDARRATRGDRRPRGLRARQGRPAGRARLPLRRRVDHQDRHRHPVQPVPRPGPDRARRLGGDRLPGLSPRRRRTSRRSASASRT